MFQQVDVEPPQVVIPPPASFRGLLMEPFAPPSPEALSLAPRIVGNATPASGEDWPATRFFRYKSSPCTATLIGSRVVLTAAHCVANHQNGTLHVGSQSYRVACEHHDNYKAGTESPDVALCLVSATVDMGVRRFERLASNPTSPADGEDVLVQGFGCRVKDGLISEDVLWTGPVKIASTRPDSLFISTYGTVALCTGDSGGGAFIGSGFNRVLVGVNARSDMVARSTLTRISHPLVRTFMDDWLRRQNTRGAPPVEICGLTPGARNCNG